jgi:hypothetical protein
MAYTYDPSQNIQQGLQQAASGVGNIFTQIIAQQQRDFNLAENAFQNIEALKKNLNIFGQKSITSKANDLLGKTSSAIMKNGKLDYSALGDIRQQVSEIGDLKQGYDVGAKEYERMLQLGIANKDNLVSFEKFYKDLSAKMGDENLVKNPQDLQKALADSYTNNLDATKIYGKGFLNANPYYKIEQDVTNPKTGALMRVQGELPRGWSIDPTTGRAIPPAPKTMVVNGQQVTMDYVDQELARIQATSPEQLVLMRKQAGSAGQNVSDKDLVKDYIDRVPMLAKSVQVKSKDDLRTEQARATSAEFEAATAPQKLSAQLGQMRASTNLTNTQAALAGEQLKMYQQPQTLTDYKKFGIQFDDNGARLNLGGSVAFDLVKPDGTTMKVGASEIYSKGGKKYLKYYVPNASKDLDEQIRTGFQGSTAKEIPLPDDFAQSQTYTNLQNALMGNKTGKKALLSNALKYLPSAIDGYKPTSSVASTNKKLGMYKGFDLDVLAAGNKGFSVEQLKDAIDNPEK